MTLQQDRWQARYGDIVYSRRDFTTHHLSEGDIVRFNHLEVPSVVGGSGVLEFCGTLWMADDASPGFRASWAVWAALGAVLGLVLGIVLALALS